MYDRVVRFIPLFESEVSLLCKTAAELVTAKGLRVLSVVEDKCEFKVRCIDSSIGYRLSLACRDLNRCAVVSGEGDIFTLGFDGAFNGWISRPIFILFPLLKPKEVKKVVSQVSCWTVTHCRSSPHGGTFVDGYLTEPLSSIAISEMKKYSPYVIGMMGYPKGEEFGMFYEQY